MALSGIEQLEGSRDTRVSVRTGIRTKRRRFFVPSISENDALHAENIPRDRSETFPGESDLLLIEVSTTLASRGTGTYVDCYYSNQAGGSAGQTRQQAPTEDLVTKRDWQHGAVMVVTEAPLNIRARVANPGATGPSTAQYLWTLGKLQFEQRRIIRSLDVFVEVRTEADMAKFDMIDAQANHLHKIRGVYYRYTPPLTAVQKYSDRFQKVRHVWEQDLGTPMPVYTVGTTPAPDSQPRVLLQSGSMVSPTMLRDPYARLSSVPPENPAADTFSTISFFEYPIDDDGWRALPGVPDLG